MANSPLPQGARRRRGEAEEKSGRERGETRKEEGNY
jgi:hypothetical protein